MELPEAKFAGCDRRLLVCTVEMIGSEPLRRRRQGCASARPALHVSTLLFAASANASCAIGAEALSHQLNKVFAFSNVRCRIAQERVPSAPWSAYYSR